jgi:pyruvate/2-oxoglutarate dehydrogenase complex dihydrolipoamide dehydrogenase (E3) component
MPSRVWLTALDRIKASSGPPLMHHREELKSELFDLSSIASHLRSVSESWTSHLTDQLKERNIQTVIGLASFTSSNEIAIREKDGSQQILQADAFIIAAGSTPYFPPMLEPDSLRVFSPGTIDRITTLPKSMIVIGDGPPGFEFVHIFSQLGIDLTWLVLEGGPRTTLDPEADRFLINAFRQQAVTIEPGEPIAALERHKNKVVAVKPDGTQHEAEMAFVTVGYRPNLTPLNLAAAGLQTDNRGLLQTDDYGHTDVPSIYLVGDAKFAMPGNNAMALARISALHAVGQEVLPFDRESAMICIGLNPQVAQVGSLKGDGGIQSICVDYKASISPHITNNTEGFVRIAWNNQKQIVGELAVGMQATEALAPVAMAIKMKASVDDLASMQGAHPTISELPFIAARAIQYSQH